MSLALAARAAIRGPGRESRGEVRVKRGFADAHWRARYQIISCWDLSQLYQMFRTTQYGLLIPMKALCHGYLMSALTSLSCASFGSINQNTMLPSRSRPPVFILDFDGTITTKDTIGVVAEIAIKFHKQRGQDLSKSWDEVVRQYAEDYASHVDSYLPSKQDRTSLQEEMNYQRSMQAVELRSFARVSQSGIFRDVSEEDWRAAGAKAVIEGHVVVRNGFKTFIDRIQTAGSSWDIVSVNFCAEFIRGVLMEELQQDWKTGPRILANAPDQEGILRGPMMADDENKAVLAASDAKLKTMKDVMRSRLVDGDTEVIYIGDSTTDIECLTEAGVTGIIMADDEESTLCKTFGRVGWETVNLEEGYKMRMPRSIGTARDFENILRSPLWESMAGR